MKLNFTVDMDDLYGEDGIDFESIITSALEKKITESCKNGLASEKFNEFAKLTSDTIIAGTKLKMENFLSEEIALTEGWGKPTFVGSIEDLMKKRFDDTLLRPVDSSGKALQGCTTSDSDTWIEWMLKSHVRDTINSYVKTATSKIEQMISKEINAKITEIKDESLKRQVDDAFTSILKRS